MYGTYIGVSVRRPRPAAPEVAMTWNPADKGTSLILANGNLTTTNSPAGWDIVRATRSASSGKRYYEILSASQATGSGNDHMIGVARSTATLTAAYLGQDANGWGFQFAKNTPLKWNNGVSGAYGSYNAGDVNVVYGILFDFDAGELVFTRNGVSIGVAYTGIGAGTMFPAVASYSSFQMTARFASASWTYTPPAGYVGWGA